MEKLKETKRREKHKIRRRLFFKETGIELWEKIAKWRPIECPFGVYWCGLKKPQSFKWISSESHYVLWYMLSGFVSSCRKFIRSCINSSTSRYKVLNYIFILCFYTLALCGRSGLP